MSNYRKYELNLEKSPDDSRDWVIESIMKQNFYPDGWDLRFDLPKIRDQGRYGTCAAQTAACMKEWQEKKDIQYSGYMSPQFVYSLRENKNSPGMYCRDVMKILSNNGICTEDEFPYETLGEPSEQIIEKAKNHIIKGYAKINTVEGLKKALYKYGPCLIAVPVYNKGKMMWKPEYKGQEVQGGHAMTVVGYGNNNFIVRNSWGDDWGNKGYCKFPFKDWGCQWEVWSTVDAESEEHPKRKVKRYTFLCCQ
tara:strand:+ start:7495 stop:8247 length:753 start_codon:yes stop_codon:yes gene_type:complete